MSTDESQITEVYNKILQKAKEDGVITDEEQAILDRLKLDVDKYKEMLKKAKADNIITEGEARELQELRAKMIDRAYHTADQDSVIDSDEASILNLLLKLLRKVDL
ncbi:MAG: hypothetical protein IH840_17265 [Candidatus Heimdallarchaeota archaeon]|nr:hypothetical protein [Candidatus Heimdallarchaeota archaeon]